MCHANGAGDKRTGKSVDNSTVSEPTMNAQNWYQTGLVLGNLLHSTLIRQLKLYEGTHVNWVNNPSKFVSERGMVTSGG